MNRSHPFKLLLSMKRSPETSKKEADLRQVVSNRASTLASLARDVARGPQTHGVRERRGRCARRRPARARQRRAFRVCARRQGCETREVAERQGTRGGGGHRARRGGGRRRVQRAERRRHRADGTSAGHFLARTLPRPSERVRDPHSPVPNAEKISSTIGIVSRGCQQSTPPRLFRAFTAAS